jgi:hypothetical protein
MEKWCSSINLGTCVQIRRTFCNRLQIFSLRQTGKVIQSFTPSLSLPRNERHPFSILLLRRHLGLVDDLLLHVAGRQRRRFSAALAHGHTIAARVVAMSLTINRAHSGPTYMRPMDGPPLLSSSPRCSNSWHASRKKPDSLASRTGIFKSHPHLHAPAECYLPGLALLPAVPLQVHAQGVVIIPIFELRGQNEALSGASLPQLAVHK